jgi:hypothetical protein
MASLYQRFQPYLRDLKLSSKSGVVLDLNEKAGLRHLDPTDFPLFLLSSKSVKRITIRGEDESGSVLDFDPLAKISDLKNVIARRLGLPPLFHLLNAHGSQDPDGLLLRDAGTAFMWVNATDQVTWDKSVQVLPPQARGRRAHTRQTVYRLNWDGAVTEIELGDHQTVGEAKRIYGARVNVGAEHVALLWGERVLQDAQVLSRRIPRGQEIVVRVGNGRGNVQRSNPDRVGRHVHRSLVRR